MQRNDSGDRRLAREVFARTRIAPRPDLARRVRERVAVERERRARSDGSWQLMVAGSALAMALVVGMLVNSGVLDLPGWGSSAPTPAPDAATLGSDGPSAPTFLLAPAGGGAGPLRRLDWAGRAIGSLLAPDGALSVSPDGALVAITAAVGQMTVILDAGGRPVARLTSFGAWSGDGAHVACAVTEDEAGVRMSVADLRGAAVRLSDVALPLDGTGWVLGGCSARADRLVALRETAPSTVAEVVVVSMSGGRVLQRLAYDDGLPPVAPVLSPDARYLAENDPERRAAGIRDLVSGEVVGHVTGLVAAFTGDAQLVLVNGELGAPGPGSRASLVDWRWRRTVWAAAGHATPLAARPARQALVLTLAVDGAADPSILLVDGSGRAVDLAPSSPRSGSLAA